MPELDLERYSGEWYEVARLPNRWQKDCAGEVAVRYTLRSGGRIDVLNRCNTVDGAERTASGVARPAGPGGSPSKLEVRFAPGFLSFIPGVWADYWVIGLDPGYAWAAVGQPSRKYFWILSRTPTLSRETLQEIIESAERQGYDLSQLLETRQEH